MEIATNTAEDRSVARDAGLDPEIVSAIRNHLKTKPSQYVVQFLFSTAFLSASKDNSPVINDAVSAIRKSIRTRSRLFKWVYGSSNPHASDAVHVRLPSLQKRLLVNLLLADCRPRYPWMTSRYIHGLAFGPNGFNRNRVEMPNDWGPLYKRATIPRGGGNRSR